MKVNILTPVNLGGPHLGGKKLVELLNKRGIKAIHTYKTTELLTTPLFPKADLVHSMDLPLAYRLWKKPVVLTLKGDYTIQKNKWQKFYPRAIRKANVLTTTSKYLRDRLNLDNPIIIPNAVDSERFKPANHSDKSTINILTLTKFTFKDKSQGVLNIVDNLNKIKSDKKIIYTIIGHGPYLKEIKAQVKSDKISINFIEGVVEPANYLQKSDIFLYYSIHDVFPNAILEAMASGLPIVTNNVGAIPEMIDDNKTGFIREDGKDYQDAISNLLGDYKLRQAIGRAARDKVIKDFSWPRITEEYLNAYRKVCEF